MPPMCTACGQMLQGTEVKCPSCGAPLRSAPRPAKRSGRLTVAGVLFLGILLSTATYGGYALLRSDDFASGSGSLGSYSFAVTGHVRLVNGSTAPGVNVSVVRGGVNTTTDANGTYTLHGLPLGYNVVRFTAPGYTALEERVYLYQDVTVNPTLAAGNGTALQDHESYGTLVWGAKVWGGILVGLSMLLLGGAVACYRRRNYALALTAAWCSVLAVIAIPPAIILSFILIVLIVRSKREFA